MTDQFGFMDENDQFGQPNTSDNKGLRNWAKSVQDQNKELQNQLAQVQAQLKAQQAVNTFEDLGLPRAAASLYSGELTPDAINAWASQVRNAFGVAPTDGQSAPQNTQPALTPEQQAQLQNITNAGANATPSTSLDDHQRSINNAGSIQDLLAAWGNVQR